MIFKTIDKSYVKEFITTIKDETLVTSLTRETRIQEITKLVNFIKHLSVMSAGNMKLVQGKIYDDYEYMISVLSIYITNNEGVKFSNFKRERDAFDGELISKINKDIDITKLSDKDIIEVRNAVYCITHFNKCSNLDRCTRMMVQGVQINVMHPVTFVDMHFEIEKNKETMENVFDIITTFHSDILKLRVYGGN